MPVCPASLHPSAFRHSSRYRPVGLSTPQHTELALRCPTSPSAPCHRAALDSAFRSWLASQHLEIWSLSVMTTAPLHGRSGQILVATRRMAARTGGIEQPRQADTHGALPRPSHAVRPRDLPRTRSLTDVTPRHNQAHDRQTAEAIPRISHDQRQAAASGGIRLP